MAIEFTTTTNGERTFHTAGKYCDQDIVITTNVQGSAPVLITKNITENGTYTASSDNADGYSSVTVNVSGGGGGDSGGRYWVVAIDYDGTILKQDHLNAGATFTLPTPPTHSRLTFQEWSSPVQIVNNTVTVGYCDMAIGATYTTASGLSEFDIELNQVTGLTIDFYMGSESGTTVNWGDGTTTTDGTTSHTYTDYGKYTITCDASEFTPTTTDYYYSVFGQSSSNKNYFCTAAFLNVQNIPKGVFRYCFNLKHITIAKVTSSGYGNSFGNDCFMNCYNLVAIVLPPQTTDISYRFASWCEGLLFCIIPYGVTKFSVSSTSSNAFSNCASLKILCLPVTLRSINGTYSCSGCVSLKSVQIPQFSHVPNYTIFSLSNLGTIESVTYMSPSTATSSDASLLAQANLVKYIKILDSVTTIGANSFMHFYIAEMYDFTDCTSVKTLANVNAFSNIPAFCKIVVPDSLYASWIAATNWVTYANYIYKASEVTL